MLIESLPVARRLSGSQPTTIRCGRQSVWLLAGLLVAFGTAPVVAAPPPPGLVVRVVPVVGAAPMELETRRYEVAGAGAVTFTTCRFYLCGLRLTFADGTTWAEPDSYHLIDAEDSASWRLVLIGAPDRPVQALTFSFGVDSAANVAGALGGALDPARGMYWAWHSGYVNAKLEGHSAALSGLRHEFAWHVGGFQGPHATRRTRTLAVPVGADNTLVLRADVGAWLTAGAPVQNPSVLVAGSAAARLADAAVGMFSLESPRRRAAP